MKAVLMVSSRAKGVRTVQYVVICGSLMPPFSPREAHNLCELYKVENKMYFIFLTADCLINMLYSV